VPSEISTTPSDLEESCRRPRRGNRAWPARARGAGPRLQSARSPLRSGAARPPWVGGLGDGHAQCYASLYPINPVVLYSFSSRSGAGLDATHLREARSHGRGAKAAAGPAVGGRWRSSFTAFAASRRSRRSSAGARRSVRPRPTLSGWPTPSAGQRRRLPRARTTSGRRAPPAARRGRPYKAAKTRTPLSRPETAGVVRAKQAATVPLSAMRPGDILTNARGTPRPARPCGAQPAFRPRPRRLPRSSTSASSTSTAAKPRYGNVVNFVQPQLRGASRPRPPTFRPVLDCSRSSRADCSTTRPSVSDVQASPVFL